MREKIVGREEHIAALERYVAGERSEFIAIYGRRRVGKTFLVKELFEDRFFFRVTGRDNVTTKEQLANFNFALNEQLGIEARAENWSDALLLLRRAIEAAGTDDAKIIFIDELPWFDTARSGFVSALEHFWNDWANYRNDVKIITCGSATTWMLNKVINAHGGLHNRATHTMLIEPFTLYEAEAYFKSRGMQYERLEIISAYMAVGGVAYYLSLFEPDMSVAQNINRLCFSRSGELVNEFDRLFKSLFRNTDNYVSIVEALKNKGAGMTRGEILNATHLTNNGNFSNMLAELEQCDFIRSYNPFGKTKKERVYQLIDPFCLFYFKFMRNNLPQLDNYWMAMQSSPAYASWCGHAFEIVCLHHINEIVRALGIDGSINEPCSWVYRPSKAEAEQGARGAQIDLLIDRSDRCISVCEIKFATGEYEITRDYNSTMQHKLQVFKQVTGTRKTLLPTFITPEGLYNNMYARNMSRQVVGDDLFVMRRR